MLLLAYAQQYEQLNEMSPAKRTQELFKRSSAKQLLKKIC